MIRRRHTIRALLGGAVLAAFCAHANAEPVGDWDNIHFRYQLPGERSASLASLIVVARWTAVRRLEVQENAVVYKGNIRTMSVWKIDVFIEHVLKGYAGTTLSFVQFFDTPTVPSLQPKHRDILFLRREGQRFRLVSDDSYSRFPVLTEPRIGYTVDGSRPVEDLVMDFVADSGSVVRAVPGIAQNAAWAGREMRRPLKAKRFVESLLQSSDDAIRRSACVEFAATYLVLHPCLTWWKDDDTAYGFASLSSLWRRRDEIHKDALEQIRQHENVMIGGGKDDMRLARESLEILQSSEDSEVKAAARAALAQR